MDDVFSAEEPQALDQRVGKSADQVEAEALVVVLFDQLVQVETVNQNNSAVVKHTRIDH